MAAIDGLLAYLYHAGVYPELHPILFRMFKLVMPKNSGLAYIGQFAQDAMKDQNEPPGQYNQDKSQGDFLSRLLKMHEQNPFTVTQYDVLGTCRDNIGAGSDTTGISLTAVICHLYRNPNALLTLRHEIDKAESEGQTSNPITFQEAQRMPYLQAVIKEAMRLHPAAGFQLERVVPKDGSTICGHFFNEGVRL